MVEGTNHEFTKTDFDRASERTFAAAERSGGKTQGVGSTTLQRAVLQRSILSAAGSPNGREILVSFEQKLHQSGINPNSLPCTIKARTGVISKRNAPETFRF